MEAIPREIPICRDENGREPFTEWLDTLTVEVLAIILNRVDRVEGGLLGDVRFVGEGVFELRIDHGLGYRIYFAQLGTEVHLISGGSKSNQQRDIDAAKRFWSGHD